MIYDPAFPRRETLYPDGSTSDPGHVGMTLRDYFASHATEQDIIHYMDEYTTRAEARYRFADSMLKAREI